MKETALTAVHISLGAKMAEFAGYNMPISYSGINNEHLQVRNSVGVDNHVIANFSVRINNGSGVYYAVLAYGYRFSNEC